MNARCSPAVLILVGLFLATPFAVHAQAVSRTEALRDIDSQIEQQKQNASAAQKALEDALRRGDSASANVADAVLQGAKGLIDALLKQKDQVTAPLTDANKQCQPVIKKCGCGKIPGPFNSCIGGPNMWQCKCYQKVNADQLVTGTCKDTQQCEGQAYSGLDGTSTGVGDIGGVVGQIFKGLLDKVMGGLGGGGGAPAGGGGYQGCTQYYQVTVPTSDPCATYVPPTSDSLLSVDTSSAASQQLLDALNDGQYLDFDAEGAGEETVSASVSQQLLNAAQTSPVVITQTGIRTGTSTLLASTTGSIASLQSGTQGDIQIRGTGATVVANSRDAAANTEVAGFYGSDTVGSAQPQGIVAGMCRSRPWAGSVVSFVIPPSFFDSLCAWRGYQVGMPQPAVASPQPAAAQQTAPAGTVAAPAPAPTLSVPPSVDIWATPASVALGGRTSIFWNAQGVVSCTTTSPSGNFNQSTLSGGAATVPLSGPTTFVITCVAPDGASISDEVVVGLAI